MSPDAEWDEVLARARQQVVEETVISLEGMDLPKAPIFILRSRATTPLDDEQLKPFIDGICRRWPDAALIILDADTTLESVNEEQMRAAGWVRA